MYCNNLAARQGDITKVLTTVEVALIYSGEIPTMAAISNIVVSYPFIVAKQPAVSPATPARAIMSEALIHHSFFSQ